VAKRRGGSDSGATVDITTSWCVVAEDRYAGTRRERCCDSDHGEQSTASSWCSPFKRRIHLDQRLKCGRLSEGASIAGGATLASRRGRIKVSPQTCRFAGRLLYRLLRALRLTWRPDRRAVTAAWRRRRRAATMSSSS
jgi:hypothetical protein